MLSAWDKVGGDTEMGELGAFWGAEKELSVDRPCSGKLKKKK